MTSPPSTSSSVPGRRSPPPPPPPKMIPSSSSAECAAPLPPSSAAAGTTALRRSSGAAPAPRRRRGLRARWSVHRHHALCVGARRHPPRCRLIAHPTGGAHRRWHPGLAQHVEASRPLGPRPCPRRIGSATSGGRVEEVWRRRGGGLLVLGYGDDGGEIRRWVLPPPSRRPPSHAIRPRRRVAQRQLEAWDACLRDRPRGPECDDIYRRYSLSRPHRWCGRRSLTRTTRRGGTTCSCTEDRRRGVSNADTDVVDDGRPTTARAGGKAGDDDLDGARQAYHGILRGA